MQSICVFCGSSFGAREVYRENATALGRLLAQRRITTVYGGGKVGLMGALADAALEHGGNVIGVMPQALVAKEIAHTGLTQLHVVGSLHERKARMAELSDAFVVLPGGFGTFEELCEIISWAQIGLHSKPLALINIQGFYAPLLELFDRAVEEQFLLPRSRALVLEAPAPEQALDRLLAYRPQTLDRWGDRIDEV